MPKGKLKKNGKKMQLLLQVASRHPYGFLTDYEYHPPAKVMNGLKKKGLVVMMRMGSRRCQRTLWFLSDKAIAMLGVDPA
jgi:hypothetical protein